MSVFAKKSQFQANNELKILQKVPCGDRFLNCKFIKKAHESKSEIDLINESVKGLEGDILELKNIISSLKSQDIDSKIYKYNEVLNKEYKANIDIENIKEKIERKKNQVKESKSKLKNLNNIHEEIKNLNLITKKRLTLKSKTHILVAL